MISKRSSDSAQCSAPPNSLAARLVALAGVFGARSYKKHPADVAPGHTSRHLDNLAPMGEITTAPVGRYFASRKVA